MNKSKIKKLALTALFTAVIAASAWLSIPTPFGVNLAFSLFGVCIAAFCLGTKGAIWATLAYIALGAVGMPVFSLFSGGLGVLFGASGGFIWGFLPAAAICGISKSVSKKGVKFFLMLLAVIICHLIGVIQYSFVTGNGILIAFLTASFPFIIKDALLVLLASFVSKRIKI